MTSTLMCIDDSFNEFLQQIANAVSTVLRFDVTVANHQLVRVAGTGRYKSLIGQELPASCSFAEATRKKRPYMVTDRNNDPVCDGCAGKAGCIETCHMCYPLSVGDTSLGVIALVGFTDEQRHRIQQHGNEYMDFLHQMARLVEKAAQSDIAKEELRKTHNQLQGIVESVGEGIIAIDETGNIVCCNNAAVKTLKLEDADIVGKNIKRVFPSAPIFQIAATGTQYKHLEMLLRGQGKAVRLMSTASPLVSEGQIIGAVALVRSIEDVTKVAYQMTDGQPTRAIEDILGDSPAIRKAKQMALRTAMSSSSALLRGESGTGKELFARAIHYHSPRSHGPFVAVNCAAVPEELLESELFGYEDGAFTGARRGGKPGKFEVANEGTLFLDEIGDCSLRLQAKLLRALDSGEIQRVGGTHSMKTDVRIVSATNKNLERMVEDGEFREDLYFRLNVIPIWIPPLRERKEDIIPLFSYFLHKYSAAMDCVAPNLSQEATQILLHYEWPGNVRELQNTAQYVLHTCIDEIIRPQHLPARFKEASAPDKTIMPDVAPKVTSVESWEKKLIEDGLRRLENVPKAKDILAEQLGMSRATIYRKIKKYGLDTPTTCT
ncbi:MAG TPA: sigma 54-interacting transcriptional regulator [Bacillota bacterium]|nr:sigma 54-interacting transcriptional regulator [Bacillota bacterium]